jgi:hypothetical protein
MIDPVLSPRITAQAGVTRLPSGAIAPALGSGNGQLRLHDNLPALQKFARTFPNFS